MKKVISLVLVVLMLAATLCACGDPQAGTPSSTPVASTPNNTPAGDKVVDVSDYMDAAKWEFDSDLATIKDGKMTFDCNMAGEFCAAMLEEPVTDGSYKFTLTVTKQPEDANSDEIFWETELFIIARASKPGTTWSDGTQTGYCISSWGDLSTFCLGRAGADDAFGTEFTWNINDGQPHEIEIGTKNIQKDGKTAVEVFVKVDGVEIARVVDEGQNGREGRPTMYPEGGNLCIRAKWMEIVVE